MFISLIVLCALVSTSLGVGSFSNVAQDSQDYSQYVTDLQKFSLELPELNFLAAKNFQVQKVETQVVAGLNVKYTLTVDGQTCHIIIWEKPWMNFKQVTTDNCPKSKRQLGGNLAGGLSEVDKSEYSKLAAMVNLDGVDGLGASQYQVVDVKQQVVAGMKYKFIIQRTGHPGTCEVDVWTQAWLHSQKVVKNTCGSMKRQLLGGGSRCMPGGYCDADVNSATVKKCITKSLDKINAMSNNMFRVVDSNVMKAETQVVAGFNIHVEFQTQESSCMNSDKNMGLNSADCAVKTNSVMTPNTWNARCFESLDGQMTATVTMEH